MSNAASNTQTPQRFSGEWETKPVSEFGNVVTGATPSTKVNAFWNGPYPWITPTDITSERDMTVSERMITQEGLNAIRTLPPNTVLITCIASIGKNAILKTIGSCNQQINAVVPNAAHNAEFLYYLFEYNSNYLLANAGVTATPIISKSIFSEFVFQVPSLEEQRSIAEALSDVDGLFNALEALIAKKQAIKQAVMQQLLTGKTRLPGFSGAWETKQLGKMGHCLRGVSYDPTTDLSSFDTDSTVRLLRSNNIQDAVVTAIDVQYVESRKVSESQVMLSDDILVCMANGSKELVGKAGLFRFNDGYIYTFGAFMGCFRVDVSVADPRFVFYLFQTHEYRNFISLILAGSSINNLKPSDIESAEFQIPDRNEQTAIVSVFSDMDAEIAALAQRRDKTRAIKQGMMQQLLTGRVRLSESRICTDLSDDAD